MLRYVVVTLIFAVVLATSGCGTLSERNGDSNKRYRGTYYFPGVQYDWGILTLKSEKSYDYSAEFCYLSIVCPFVIVLGMPIDLVVDSLLLHSDHKRKLIADKEFEGYLLDTYCHAEGGPNEEELKTFNLDISSCPATSLR